MVGVKHIKCSSRGGDHQENRRNTLKAVVDTASIDSSENNSFHELIRAVILICLQETQS